MRKRVYIDPYLHDALGVMSDGKEEALNRALSGFLFIRRATLKELVGKFTRPELVGLLDTFNGTYIDTVLPIGPKQMLQYEMEDAHELEGTPARHGYDGPALLSKLEALTDIEAWFLLDEIRRFWNETTAYGAPTPDLDKFLASYTE